MDTTPRWATKKEAAEYGRCSENLIDKYITQGQLSRAGHGRKVLVNLNELDSLILNKQPYETPWLREETPNV